MTSNNSLYQLFDVPSNCSDDELRKAYHRLMRQYHPDVNHHQIQLATVKTQEITSAYNDLKNYRRNLDIEKIDGGEKVSKTKFSIKFKFGPCEKEFVRGIHRRRKSFREAWEAFYRDSSDVLKALKFIHSAFEADQLDTVHDLLLNRILIDSASLLVFSIKSDSACQTLKEWAHFLYFQKHLYLEAIQILEDTVTTDKATLAIKQNLESMHVHFARGTTSGVVPSPAVRIEHLNRAIELNEQGSEHTYEYLVETYYEMGDYVQAREKLKCMLSLISKNTYRNAQIYKLVGKGYYKLGDVILARSNLELAQKIDPELSGVVRLARSLGLLSPKKRKPRTKKTKASFKYADPEQVPSTHQIREWAASEKWGQILAFANPHNYHPLAAHKKFFLQIAMSLGQCPDERALEALRNLLSIRTGQMLRVCILSLAKIGNQETLHLLKNLDPATKSQKFAVRNAASYLEARLTNQYNGSSDELFKLAKQVFDQDDYGKARFLLEKVAQNFEYRYKIGLSLQNVVFQNLNAQNTLTKEADLPSKEYHVIQRSVKEMIPKKRYLTFFETVLLLAQTCQNMSDYRTVTSILKPILTEMPEKYQYEASKLLLSSLWSSLMFGPYDPLDDDDYILVFNLELAVILQSDVPREVLYRVRELARWMHKLGELEKESWIRSLIRAVAPGTYYVERTGNGDNAPQVELSDYLKEQLMLVDKRIKSVVPDKLSQVLKITDSLSDVSSHTKKLLQ